MQKKITATAFGDIMAATRRLHLVGMLGWQDVRQRYRRSILGPFWLTISMGVMIGTIGLVFGQIFNSPMKVYLPFLASGMILWGFISGVVTEGCDCFIAAEGIIKQLPIPLFVHVLRMVWRNLLILAHNIVIFPLVLLAVSRPIGWLALLAIPGLLVVLANLTWVALLLGVLCTRYRDLSQIIASLLQVLYFLTPIMWMPASLPSRAATYLLDFNPVYHILSLVRLPLMDQLPSQSNWVVSLSICVVGWAVALFMYGRYKRRIAYWL
jgi:ABC-type polysaccharide/polyol phosphate export permease